MAMKILANDGIDKSGKETLEKAGFFVDANKIEQADLPSRIQEFDVLLVRSATKVTKEVMDAGNNLKLIGRAGVGVDNIDMQYAKEKGIAVVNTPAASSTSVAELVFAHLFSLARFLQITNRIMPNEGNSKFKDLKNDCSKGVELKGKTLGIIGFGRIGQETARMAIGLGMNVIAHDPFAKQADILVSFHPALQASSVKITITTVSKEQVLKESDFISLHVPGGQDYVIGEAELAMMKNKAGLINCARGGVIDEKALNAALLSGKIAFAGLDVFETEPPVYTDILQHNNVSLSPHIGASTQEAQQRIGEELAERILNHFNISAGA